jgi:mRNA interferase HigB
MTDLSIALFLKSSQFANYLYLCTLTWVVMERIFAKSTLRDFWKLHPETEQYLKTWFDTAMNANWKTPNEVKKTYVNVSILKEGRMVFNIKGNSYRLVVKVNFEKQWIFIRFIGTHEDYNKIDANTI